MQVASVSVVYMDDEGQPTKTGGVIPQSTIMRELHIKVQSGFTLPDQSCCQQCVRGGNAALQSCALPSAACVLSA